MDKWTCFLFFENMQRDKHRDTSTMQLTTGKQHAVLLEKQSGLYQKAMCAPLHAPAAAPLLYRSCVVKVLHSALYTLVGCLVEKLFQNYCLLNFVQVVRSIACQCTSVSTLYIYDNSWSKSPLPVAVLLRDSRMEKVCFSRYSVSTSTPLPTLPGSIQGTPSFTKVLSHIAQFKPTVRSTYILHLHVSIYIYTYVMEHIERDLGNDDQHLLQPRSTSAMCHCHTPCKHIRSWLQERVVGW